MKHITLFLIFCVLVACEKPNPTPETSDPIYSDMQTELGATEGALKAAEKELEGFKLDLKKVLPQTSQLGPARQRVYDSESKVNRLTQMVEYWKLKVESRKAESRKSYLAAWKDKKPWPNPAEYKEYALQKKLQKAPQMWNVKRRMEEAGIGVPIKAPGSEHGEAHAEAPPPARGEH